MLFHPKPEKFVTGAYIKIGYFENDADLIFHDEVHGNLFEQVEQTIDILFTKYIKAIISYEGIHRVETYEYPLDAIREGILNAVAHKDYSGSTPIQISVYQDKIMIWNDGELPQNWTVETLFEKHSSKPYNPDIANALFRSGYIESWGRGISKMINICIEHGLPKPNIYYKSSGIWAVFYKDIYNKEYLSNLDLNDRQLNALLFFKSKKEIVNSDYATRFNITDRTARRDLTELVERKILIKVGENKSTKYIFR